MFLVNAWVHQSREMFNQASKHRAVSIGVSVRGYTRKGTAGREHLMVASGLNMFLCSWLCFHFHF